MMQLKKQYVIIAFFSAIIAIASICYANSVNTISMSNLTYEDTTFVDETTKTFDSPVTANLTTTNFTYCRDIYLDLCNVTLDYYNNLSTEDKQHAINHICAIWGYFNGTYTEEQMDNMTNTNSPHVGFKTTVTHPVFGDDIVWYSERATPESVIRHDDEEFRIRFRIKMESALGEHATRVEAEMIKDSQVQIMFFQEVDDFWGLGHSEGSYYQGDGLYGIWGAGDVVLDIYRSTHFRGVPVQFRITVYWHKLVGLHYEDRTLVQTYSKTYDVELYFDMDEPYPLLFIVEYVNPNPINIVDDDILPPYIAITGSNLIDNTYLYDGAPYLSLSGGVHDWWALGSGAAVPIFQCNGEREIWRFIYSDDFYYYRYIVHFANPIELGTYNASIAVWDLDTDIGNEDRKFWNKTIDFQVIDDDTTGPEITIERIEGDGTDAHPGKWYITAFDEESEISNITVRVEGLGNFTILGDKGYVPACAHPEYNEINVTAYNNDLDRGYKDQEASIASAIDQLELEDDDMSGPILTLSHTYIPFLGVGYDDFSGYWTVYAEDPESGIGQIRIEIDGIYAGDEFGMYGVPNTPGNHIISVIVSNNDNDYVPDSLGHDFEVTSSYYIVTIRDDDTGPPEISILYTGTATDSDPGYWTVGAFDPSGISSMSVYIDEILVGSSDGDYDVPNSLGIHTIRVYAVDGDNDRIDDSLSNSMIKTIEIFDDDTTTPIIEITPYGAGTDEDPGGWTVNVYDLESGIDTIEVYIDQVLMGTSIGDYTISNTLGDHIIRVVAANGDLDRGVMDQEVNDLSESLFIIDDDLAAPQIENLEIEDNLSNLNINFDVVDYSGVSSITISVDGVQALYFEPLLTQSHFEFAISNDWAMDSGNHDVLIEIWDADTDRLGDSLYSYTTGQFEISTENMHDYILWEIDEFIKAVQASPNALWEGPAENRKNAIVNKLIDLKTLVADGYYAEAYDKLLHDIKPLLTGLKCDENGLIFGNGIFNNFWFIADDFVPICDVLLADLTTILNSLSFSLQKINFGIFLILSLTWIIMKKRKVKSKHK